MQTDRKDKITDIHEMLDEMSDEQVENVHVYTADDREKASNFVYVIETKTSSMAEPIQQLVSEPLDASLAQRLRDEMNGVETELDQIEDEGEISLSGETIPEDAELPEGGEEGGETGENN